MQISLTQLRTETHHRGRVLYVRRIGDLVIARTSIGAIVTDEVSGHCQPREGSHAHAATDDLMQHGEAETLKLAHGNSTLGEDGTLPHDFVLAIKEPYFTVNEQKDALISVDHSCDVVCLPLSNYRMPPDLLLEGEGGLASLKSAAEWKVIANQAFKGKALAKALQGYTSGLSAMTAEETELQSDLYRNRAQVSPNRSGRAQADADRLRYVGEPPAWLLRRRDRGRHRGRDGTRNR